MPDDKLAIVDETGLAIDADLIDKVAENLDASKADATKRAYRSDWVAFVGFCQGYGYEPLPTAPEVLAAYLSNMADAFSWATIARRLSTISQAHKVKGVENPAEHPLVREVCRGIKRRLGVAGKQAKPLLPVDLARWLPLLGDGPTGIRDASILTMGLAGGFRRSELAALRVDDVEETERGLIVTVRRSKTDQAGEGLLKGIAFGRNAVTCPVERWRAWRGIFPDEESAYGVSDKTVVRAVKRLVKLGGENPDDYSGHSLRAGFVTAAVQAGVPADVIMRQTGHKSHEVMNRYIRRASIWDENPSGLIGL